MKRLYRTVNDRKLAGVCGGLGEYFNIDPTLVRIIAIIALIFGNIATVLAYVIGIFIIPNETDARN
ncbi:PspC domain-containing protein [Alteribacter natronophilus]|uniref:PspC domain-containing protein n=1 Tax=Alteribacter natronophilus TaxID=2583810 RepID=UPI00110DAB34|nr:PspC domain-containing protein [Alteribacter natronophilus]TMW72405.1 PspC domain-containing protein [Alteribacter natronophilus]